MQQAAHQNRMLHKLSRGRVYYNHCNRRLNSDALTLILFDLKNAINLQ